MEKRAMLELTTNPQIGHENETMYLSVDDYFCDASEVF